jgi:hypothetical protein
VQAAASRVIPTAVFCALLATAAAAQPDVGFKAGVSFSQFALTPTPPDVLFNRADSTLGVFAVWPTDRLIDWQVEAMVTPAGSKIETDDEDVEFRLTYLDLAPLARVTAAELRHGELYVLAGPSFGLLLGATEVEVDQDEREVQDVEGLFTTLDVGLTAGLGLDLGRLVFEGRYRYGLTDVSTVPPDVSSEIRNRTVSFLAGFRF